MPGVGCEGWPCVLVLKFRRQDFGAAKVLATGNAVKPVKGESIPAVLHARMFPEIALCADEDETKLQ